MKRLLHSLFFLTYLWLPSANAETEQASFGGARYEGTYKDGKWDGVGTLTYPN